MRVLQLGCGQKKMAGAVGIDFNPGSQADIIHDLNCFPYPFNDNEFDVVICEHILEHLNNLVAVMTEIHRIGQPGAKVIVDVPHFSSIHFWSDPTHKTFFSTHTFDYFLAGTLVREFGYSDAQFKLLQVEFPPPEDASLLKRLVFRWINRHIDFYEKHLAFILPRHLLHFELEVVK
jgi:SAM-dependent methyltransferase